MVFNYGVMPKTEKCIVADWGNHVSLSPSSLLSLELSLVAIFQTSFLDLLGIM